MKYLKVSMYVLVMIYFSTISIPAADDDLSFNTIKKHLDTALDVASTAAGTQLPGGHMATALSAIPAATTQYLRTDTNTKMQSLAIEAMDHPEKFEECYNLINRYQAINSALGGQPERWIKIIDDNRKKNQSSGPKKTPSQTDDDNEQENMQYQFKYFDGRLNKINSQLDQLNSTTTARISSLEAQLESIKSMGAALDSAKKVINTVNIDQEIQNLKNKSSRLNQLLKNAEKSRAEISRKISSAKTHKVNCTSEADSTFIKTTFEQCEATLSELRSCKSEADMVSRYAIEEYNQLKDKINDINEQRKNYNNESSNTAKNIQQLIDSISATLNSIESDTTAKNTAISSDLTTLKNEIAESFVYYTNLFPASKTFYSQYNVRLTALKTRLADIYRTILNKIRNIRSTLSKYNNVAPDPLQPYTPKQSDINPEKLNRIVSQITTILQDAENLVQANSLLQQGCTPKPADTATAEDINSDESNEDTDNSDTNTDQTNQTTQPQDTSNTDTQQILVFGGLTIAGPASITVGDGITLIACDATGRPYPSDGSFKWNNYRNDILSLGNNSNAVSGVGFKAGKVMVQLNHEGMYAYIDIEIKEADNSANPDEDSQNTDEQSVFTSKGGNQNPTGSDTGTQDADICTSCDDDNATGSQSINFTNSKCAEIMQKLVNAIRSGNINNALHLRNLAIAESCNLNVQAANNYINQLIHNQQIVQHQHQQNVRNNQNMIILQNIINTLNNVKNNSGSHHKPESHHHHDASGSDSKTYNYDKLRNYGNALPGGSW